MITGSTWGRPTAALLFWKGTVLASSETIIGWYFTPSAVWVDKNSALHVGLAAKDRLINDTENAAAEFKLWMGSTLTKRFKRTNAVLSPEQLSAEVLKSLKQDVKRDSGEDIHAAVITVPAAFDLPQSEATKQAAVAAGISISPLLQEPIAAALAYGFDTERDNVFWLVYDFGRELSMPL